MFLFIFRHLALGVRHFFGREAAIQAHQPLLVDLRNLYSRTDIERAGLQYIGVGR